MREGITILAFAIITLVFSLIAWAGQVITFFQPVTASKLTLTEREDEVDLVYYTEVRGEALWDSVSIWILPVAAILLIIDNIAWPYFGLIGGGIYLYFAGRGISARIAYQRRDVLIGKPSTIKQAYIFLSLGCLIAVGIKALAILEMS